MGYVRQRHHLSERKAYQIVGLSRSAYRYQRKRSNDKEIRKSLKELTEKKPRWGFGKIRDYPKNKGYRWNHKRIRRVYREMGLNIRIKPRVSEKLCKWVILKDKKKGKTHE